MAMKINISDSSGKSWILELQDESLFGKSIGDKFSGKEMKEELEGYEFEIMGGSDSSGFPLSKNAEGLGLKRVLLKKGFAMRDNTKGIRRRKTIRGKQISNTTALLNVKIVKSGAKKLEEIFSDQNKKEEAKSESLE